jgi:hypothetical protein
MYIRTGFFHVRKTAHFLFQPMAEIKRKSQKICACGQGICWPTVSLCCPLYPRNPPSPCAGCQQHSTRLYKSETAISSSSDQAKKKILKNTENNPEINVIVNYSFPPLDIKIYSSELCDGWVGCLGDQYLDTLLVTRCRSRRHSYTAKKLFDIAVPSRDVTYQTLPGRE